MTTCVTGKYLGNKKVELTHGPSNAKFTTDAPQDSQGEGRFFSPTDLLPAALGSCMMTVMAIVAERSGMSLSGMHMEAQKIMSPNPRYIGSIPVVLHLPNSLTDGERQKMENAAKTCPVHHALNPEIAVEIKFIYDV